MAGEWQRRSHCSATSSSCIDDRPRHPHRAERRRPAFRSVIIGHRRARCDCTMTAVVAADAPSVVEARVEAATSLRDECSSLLGAADLRGRRSTSRRTWRLTKPAIDPTLRMLLSLTLLRLLERYDPRQCSGDGRRNRTRPSRTECAIRCPAARRTTRHRPHPRHAGRQDRAEPADERDAGGDGAGALQVVVRGLRPRPRQGRRPRPRPAQAPRRPLPRSASRTPNSARFRRGGGEPLGRDVVEHSSTKEPLRVRMALTISTRLSARRSDVLTRRRIKA